MTFSIRWKVTLSVLLAVSLGLAIAGWLALRSIEQLELARMAETVEARTSLAVFALQPLFKTHPPTSTIPQPALQAHVLELSRHASARVTVIGPDGRVLAESATQADAVPRMENHRTRPEVAQALAEGRGTDIRVSETTGQRMFYFARRLGSSADQPVAVLRLAVPLTILEARIRELQWAVGIAFGSAFLFSVVLSILLARGLTKPLSEMASVARQLASGSLAHRIHAHTQDEVGVLGTALNQMTDQLESKIREISEDRAQLLAILTSMVEGVLVLDYRGTILQVNPALERMFTISGAAARGQAHTAVIRHAALNTLIDQVLDRRQNLGGEIALEPSGRTLKVEASVAGGRRANEACAVLVFHDITALRKLETIRKDFVANVSHELRTPLTSIKGYVEALLDGAKDDPDQATRFLNVLLTQSDRLNLILEDLLQLSQIESGLVLFKRDTVHLATLVDRTVASLKPLADKKEHTLTIDIPPNLPPVAGDEGRLLQVLTNLLDNAIKYTPSNGSIRIAARTLSGRSAAGAPTSEPPRFGNEPDVDLVELSVTDTGLGIPAADRPRVFERFYRVDKARSRELGGTGLGLAIVKHIVEGHGGQVWVEGNTPTGSRFIIRLPVMQDPQDIAQTNHDTVA